MLVRLCQYFRTLRRDRATRLTTILAAVSFPSFHRVPWTRYNRRAQPRPIRPLTRTTPRSRRSPTTRWRTAPPTCRKSCKSFLSPPESPSGDHHISFVVVLIFPRFITLFFLYETGKFGTASGAYVVSFLNSTSSERQTSASVSYSRVSYKKKRVYACTFVDKS